MQDTKTPTGYTIFIQITQYKLSQQCQLILFWHSFMIKQLKFQSNSSISTKVYFIMQGIS